MAVPSESLVSRIMIRVCGSVTLLWLLSITGCGRCSEDDLASENNEFHSSEKHTVSGWVPFQDIPILSVTQDDFDSTIARLGLLRSSEATPSPADLAHIMRLGGLNTPITNRAGLAVTVSQAFLNSQCAESVMGGTILDITRYGLRYRHPSRLYPDYTSAEESHPLQILATFAELGVGLDEAVYVDGETQTLEAVFEDALAHFQLEQPELEWTAIALSTYLPPSSRWNDRFGQRFSLDDVARALTNTNLSRVSCAGTHVYAALLRLMGTDEKRTLLTKDVRDGLRVRTRQLTDYALRSQCADGGFPIFWWKEANSGDVPAVSDLTTTGHLVEGMLLCPESLRIPEHVFHAAGSWLWKQLSNAKEDDVITKRCPLTHAACAVTHLLPTRNSHNSRTAPKKGV
jgi:hypothetical protein